MDNRVEFTTVGKIRGKARPRFNTKTGKAFKVKKDTLYENLIKSSYIESGGLRFDDKSYLRMELEMHFAIPKSYSKKRRQACARNIEKPAKKPDVWQWTT